MIHALRSFLHRFRPRKRRPKGDFVIRRRYALTVTSQTTQRRIFGIRMGRWGYFFTALLLFILAGAIWIGALVYTPLRNTLPMKMQTDLRDEYVYLSMRLDSAAAASAINEAYLQNILSIMRDSVDENQALPHNQIQEIPLDSLMEASDAERSFVNRFEANERFNLSVLSPIAAEGMTFASPSPGAKFEQRISEGGIPYVIVTGANITPISAVYRGTVTNAYYTTGKGITLVIQHPNDFLSVYSGLTEIFVTKGDKVKAGTRLGLGQHDRYQLTFELWHNGAPLPPEEYISL